MDAEIYKCCRGCKYAELREVPGMGRLTCCTHPPYNSRWVSIMACPINYQKETPATENQAEK